jgi:hypothetical protein
MEITVRYDDYLSSCLFAYSMGIHHRPTLNEDDEAAAAAA